MIRLFILLAVVAPSLQSRNRDKKNLLEDGFVVVKNVLSPGELDRINITANHLVNSDKYQHLQEDKFTGSLIPLAKDSRFSELIANPEALRTLSELGLKDIKYMSGFVISKPPGGPSLGWHQDGWYFDDIAGYTTSPAQVFAMWYLSDTRVDNGCLRVLPGSHVKKHPLHDKLGLAHSDEVRSAINTNFTEKGWEDKIEHKNVDGSVNVMVTAGDMVIGDARVLHGTNPNISKERRTVITVWYIADFDKQSEHFKSGVRKLSEKSGGDLHTWSEESYRQIEHLLPGKSEGLVEEKGKGNLNEFDHNLDFMVRTSGWAKHAGNAAKKMYKGELIKRLGGFKDSIKKMYVEEF